MECVISEIIGLCPLPTGRRIHAMTEVERRAIELAMSDVATRARRNVEHDRNTLAMEQERRGESRALYSPEARALDPVLDGSVIGFESYLDNQRRVFSEDSERGQAAALARQTLFPTGATAMTRLSFVEQHAEIDTLLRRAEEPALAAALARLPDAAPMLDRIRELNAEYGRSICVHDRIPTATEVRDARDQGHELLAEIVVLIFAHFLIHAPDNKDDRAYVLEPILRQMDLARQTRRRRRAPGGLDPEPDAGMPDDDGDVLAGAAADDTVTGEFPPA